MPDWINKSIRPPTQADADAWNCVIAWHEMQGCMVTGWHNAINNSFITHWQPTLPKPVDFTTDRKEDAP